MDLHLSPKMFNAHMTTSAEALKPVTKRNVQNKGKSRRAVTMFIDDVNLEAEKPAVVKAMFKTATKCEIEFETRWNPEKFCELTKQAKEQHDYRLAGGMLKRKEC